MTKNPHESKPHKRVVGIIPMAGRASRLAGLRCSKEIYPLTSDATAHGDQQPRVVCEHLLEKMRAANVTNIYVVLREGKWDIPAHLGDGSQAGVHLAYLMMGLPYGTPYSVDQAYPFVRDATVALGFPDMVFGSDDIFTTLLAQQRTKDADVVLGLFPADRPEKVDMVEADDNGRVRQIIVKPPHSELHFSWGAAVWAPTFTDFMHDYLTSHQHVAVEKPELYVGDIVQAAIDNGLNVIGVQVSQQAFLDIGTWDDLARATDLLRGN